MTMKNCIEIYIEPKCSKQELKLPPKKVIQLSPELLFVDFGWRKVVYSETYRVRQISTYPVWKGNLKKYYFSDLDGHW